MPLTDMQQDIVTHAFNEGQLTLINNIQSSEWKDIEELLMMLRVWKSKLEKENAKILAKNLERIED